MIRKSLVVLSVAALTAAWPSDSTPRGDLRVETRSPWNNPLNSGVASLAAEPLPASIGVFRIQQQSSGRYLDAHDTPDKDFAVVTRPFQPNDTQHWGFIAVGHGVYKIQQQWTHRFLDAYLTPEHDFAVVTRPPQENGTQEWIVTRLVTGTYTIRQRRSGTYLDAHETPNKDFAVVMRPPQENRSQRWLISRVSGDASTPLP